MDGEIRRRLKRANVHMGGAFSNAELPGIVSTFRVGLIPYLPTMEHDGSPLKMYEYMKLNRPVLTSIDYGFDSPYLKNYTRTTDLRQLAEHMLGMWGAREISLSIKEDCHLSRGVRRALDEVEKAFQRSG
jgi:hypothetical protein